MTITPIAQLYTFPTKTPVGMVCGQLTKLEPQHQGVSRAGPWTIQNGELVDAAGGTIRISFRTVPAPVQQYVNQWIRLTAVNGKGLMVEDDVYNGNARKTLVVKEACQITLEQTPAAPAQQQAGPASYPPPAQAGPGGPQPPPAQQPAYPAQPPAQAWPQQQPPPVQQAPQAETPLHTLSRLLECYARCMIAADALVREGLGAKVEDGRAVASTLFVALDKKGLASQFPLWKKVGSCAKGAPAPQPPPPPPPVEPPSDPTF